MNLKTNAKPKTGTPKLLHSPPATKTRAKTRTPKKSSLSISKTGGFTLLEVLIAVAIFALAGAAVVKSAAEHLNSVGTLKNMTFATYVANNQLSETSLRASVSWPPKNNLKGDTNMAERTWYWEQTVLKTVDDDLLQVTVNVYENEDFTGSITSVSTFMAKTE